MNILIAGGSGLVGTQLIHFLKQHHQITLLTRDSAHVSHRLPEIQISTWKSLPDLDPVLI